VPLSEIAVIRQLDLYELTKSARSLKLLIELGCEAALSKLQPKRPVDGEFVFMQPLAFGINRDNVSASGRI